MSFWGSTGLKDMYSVVGGLSVNVFDFVSLIMAGVGGFVLVAGYRILFCNKSIYLAYLEDEALETVWTLIPVLILFVIAVPSLSLLYVMDEIGRPFFCFKAIGHQWYWSYEFVDKSGNSVEFDSYMLKKGEGGSGNYELLDVDQRLVLPVNVWIRSLITSDDVIHGFAVPSCFVKVDGVPGRINEVVLQSRLAGVVYGQCSEICGADHSFMPIVIEFIDKDVFMKYISVY